MAGPLAEHGPARGSTWAARLRLLHSAFRQEADNFDSSYVDEIIAKYVAASAELIAERTNKSRPVSNAATNCQIRCKSPCATEDPITSQPQETATHVDREETDSDEDAKKMGISGLSGRLEDYRPRQGEAEEDILDEALDAMLHAEMRSGAAFNRFTDDYDVLASSEMESSKRQKCE